MQKNVKSLIAAAALALTTAASAAPVSTASLQNVLNGLYGCATCTGTAPDANANQANEVGTFIISAAQASVNTMIIEIAGQAGTNKMGVYDPYSMAKLELFGGAASSASQSLLMMGLGAGSTINFTSVNLGTAATPFVPQTVSFQSNVFGYYLDTIHGTFYSEAGRNANNNDHLVTYQGNGSDKIQLNSSAVPSFWGVDDFILAWEDLPNLGDKDYNDMIVYVSNVRAVPEPGSLALLGLGLAGVAAFARRQRKQA